jgi:hypothetical protein
MRAATNTHVRAIGHRAMGRHPAPAALIPSSTFIIRGRPILRYMMVVIGLRPIPITALRLLLLKICSSSVLASGK